MTSNNQAFPPSNLSFSSSFLDSLLRIQQILQSFAEVNGFELDNLAPAFGPELDAEQLRAIGDRFAQGNFSGLPVAPGERQMLDVNRATGTTLVCIDSQVKDYRTLKAGVLPNSHVVVLNAAQDGILQITQAIQQAPFTIHSLHIISHGSPGCLYLGNRQLRLDTLSHYESSLNDWFNHFNAQRPTLSLYGCTVAAGDVGAEFLHRLSELTGATIAASTQTMGNGYWTLDRCTGVRHPSPSNHQTLPILPAILNAYSHSLAAGDLDSTFGTNGITTTNLGASAGIFSVAIASNGDLVVAGVINNSGSGTSTDFALARYSANGTLDTTFGTSGTVSTDFNGGADSGEAVLLDSSNRIIVVGSAVTSTSNDFALARYSAGGVLDTTFGTNGKVLTDFESGNDRSVSAVLDGSGSIIVAGFATTGGNTNFALARYSADGVLDTSFGTGGTVTTDLNGGLDLGERVTVDGSGNIVVVGRAQNASGNVEVALARYTSAGVLDTTFGTGGKATLNIGSGIDAANDIVIDASGNILIAGTANDGNNDLLLVRFTNTGTLDTSFGTSGIVTTDLGTNQDFGNSLTVDPAGNIVVAGQTFNASSGTSHDFVVARYTSAGVLDTTFGTGGRVITDINGEFDLARDVVISSDGNIILAGQASNGGTGEFTLARYLSELSLDTTPPTLTSITRQTPTDETTNADTLIFRVTFDEDVQNVTGDDFEVTGTTATVTGVSGGGTTYDLTVSGGDLANFNGTVGVDLASGQDIQDVAGNALPGAEPTTDETYTLDNSVSIPSTPDLNVSSDSGSSSTDNLTNDTTPTFTGTAEANASIELFNGGTSLGTTTADASGNWSFTMGSALSEGAHTITAQATDGVGNVSAISAGLAFTVDTTVPTVSLSTTAANPTNLSPIPVTITFNEAVHNFELGDLVVSNGTAANLSTTDNITFTAEITPTADGSVTVDVAANVAQDTAGNGNTVAVQLGTVSERNTPTVTAVTPNLTVIGDSAVGTGTFTLTVTFDEAMDQTVNPTISFPTAGEDASSILTNVSGSWTNATTYVATYDVVDTNTKLAAVDIQISGAQDLGGNTQTTFTAANAIDIDTDFIVTNLNDSGIGSLRQAILNANASSGADTITFDPSLSGSISLTSGELAIQSSVTIDGDVNGDGTGDITIDAQGNSRVLHINDGSNATDAVVNLSNLTITGGQVTGHPGGGGILNSENLTITNSTIKGNTAKSPYQIILLGGGGGIWNSGTGTLTIARSIITGNSTDNDGGGIYSTSSTANGATVTITDSWIYGNTAGDNGGGVANSVFIGGGGSLPDASVINIINSTISGNSANDGGGVSNFGQNGDGGAVMNIINSTISGNTATFTGGGLYSRGQSALFGATINLTNSTVTQNEVTHAAGRGGGIFNTGFFAVNSGRVVVSNSIIAQNTASTDPSVHQDFPLANAPIVDQGNNLIDIDSQGLFTTSTLVGSTATPLDPRLDPLADNGGLTQTHALASDSPAIDAGNNGSIPTEASLNVDVDGDGSIENMTISVDQRGRDRLSNSIIDIGAVEFSNLPPVITLPVAPSTGEDIVDYTITGISIADNDSDNQTVTINVSNGTISLNGTAGLVFTTGDGNNDISLAFSGSLANINTALNSLTFTPSADFDGTAAIQIQSTDNIGGSDTKTLNITVNNAPEVTSINRGDTTPSNANSVTFDIAFSEAVTGVDAADFSLATTGSTAGTISSVTGSGNTYTVTVNSITGDGNLGLNLVDDDSITNGNAVALGGAGTTGTGDGGSIGQTYQLDNTAPVVSAPSLDSGSDSGVSNSDRITNDTTPTFTGIAEVNASIELFNGGTSLGTTTADASGNWSFTVGSALAEGSHTITARATDAVGNVSAASASSVIIVDTTVPTVALNTAAANPNNLSPIPVTITFSEAVHTFVLGDIVVGNGTASNLTTSDNITFTADITPTADGPVTVDVAANVAQDTAGNDNTVAVQLGTVSDRTAPTVTSVTPNLTLIGDSNVGTDRFTLTVVFSEDMNQTVNPTISFPTAGEDASSILTNVSGTWTNATTYVATYDIADANEAITAVDIQISGAQDVIGNAQTPFTAANAIDIDTDLTVTNLNDSGLGSLRQAILNANASGGGTITFDPSLSGSINLTSGQLAIRSSVTINGDVDGDGLGDITIDAQGNSRVILIDDGQSDGADETIILENLNITGGTVAGPGGGIFTRENLSLTNSTLSNNASSGYGGGIFSSGSSLIIASSTISNNTSNTWGGGFFNSGGANVTVTNSTISGNSAGAYGGGITNYGATATITNSTVSGNTANNHGGGIFNRNATVTLANSTISGNSSSRAGGAIHNQGSTVTLSNNTITSNSANGFGGGIANFFSSTLTLSNTIVAGNNADADGDGNGTGNEISNGATITADGHNLLGHSGLTNAQALDRFTPGASDITATSDGTQATALTNILDTTLANNGGPTQTHALVFNSPAVDAGNNANLPTEASLGVDVDGNGSVESTAISVDQVGGDRPFGPTVDIGAVELQNDLPVITLPATPSTVEDIVDYTIAGISIADSDNDNQTVTITVTNGTISLNGIVGLAFTTGNGTNDNSLSFSGTVASINTALNNLTFTPPADFDGTAAIQIQSTDNISGTDTKTLNITVNNAPEVTSINRGNANPTNANSVSFNVAFSEAVTGVDAGDFALATTGTTAGSISNVTGSGTNYTVTVNGITGDGTLGLNLVDNDSISVGNTVALGGVGTTGTGDGSATGPAYTFDNAAPTVTSVTPNLTLVGDSNIGTGTFTLTVVFDEAMDTGVNPTISFPTAGEDANNTLTNVSGTWTNATTYVATYDVADANEEIAAIDIQISGAQDAVGNAQTTFTAANALDIDTDFVVTNTNDSGIGSLRQAILNANATNGTATITFAIAGTGPHTISLASALPAITDTVIIDGYSQAGASENTLATGNDAIFKIVLDGNGLANGNGLSLVAGADGSTVQGLVIQNFPELGIYINSTNHTIRGNFIGTDVSGTQARGNANGIYVYSANNIIGGSAVGDRNLISGNDAAGILFIGASANNNQILGNSVGTQRDGTSALGNGQVGIGLANATTGNQVGGATAGAGNISAHNGTDGIAAFSGSDAVIQGNTVFANTRMGILANGSNHQILDNTSHSNGEVGIATDAATSGGIAILRNRVYNNGGIGIDLEYDGVTVNDVNDIDTGNNGLQNFPVFDFAELVDTDLVVNGSLNSTASENFRIEFFLNDALDASGQGEGRTYLGSQNITTDAAHAASFSVNLGIGAALGKFVTATATNLTTNETSEFSLGVEILAPTVSITPATLTQTEGTGSNTDYSFTVSLSQASSQAITVDYQTNNGTATTPADYTDNDATLTFAPGETTKAITVTAIGDSLDEADETFTVELTGTSASGGISGSNTVTATITDDDNPPNLSIGDITVNEADSTATLTVSLDAPSGKTITVDYTTTDGSAVAGSDYTATANTLTFAPGDTQKAIAVPILNDGIAEALESFTVTLSNAVNAVLAQPTATVTVNDNDAATLSIADAAIAEGTGGTTQLVFDVTLTENVDTAFTVDFGTANIAALAGTDYTAQTGTLNFVGTDGEIQQITIDITPDTLVELDETFNVTLSNVQASGRNVTIAQAIATGTLTNDDGATLSIANATIAEGTGGTTQLLFDVTLTGNVDTAFTVDFNTTDITALAGTDYTAQTGTLNFAGTDGEVQQITIDITPDTLVELDENFNVTLSNVQASGRNLSIAQATATGILSNDDGATVSIADATIIEGTGGITQLVFDVTLSGTVDSSVQVDFATADSTAIAGTDYLSNSGTLTFNGTDGEVQQVAIAISPDNQIELDEDFTVTLSNVQANSRNVTIAQATATGTITNDDAATISIADATIIEGTGGTTQLVFDVTLTGNVDTAFTVDFATADITALAGSDYIAQTGILNFAGNDGEVQKITININPDTLVELDEDFTVSLSNIQANGRNVTIAQATATGTLTNDDGASLAIADATIVEGTDGITQLIFDVTLTGDVDAGVSVDFDTTDITALADSDYTAQTGTLNFTGNDGEVQQITIDINPDALIELDEDFSVTLSNAQAGGRDMAIAQATATATITDDDEASLSIADATVIEGTNGTTQLIFDITLTGNVDTDFSVDFATGDSDTGDASAIAGTDYTAQTGTLNFEGNDGEIQQIIIDIEPDSLVEPDETLAVTLSNLQTNGRNIAIAQAIALGSITNDDTTTVSIDDVTLTEGDEGTTEFNFTVSLDQTASEDVSLLVNTNDVGAVAGEDYQALTNQRITIPAGQRSTTVTVNGIGDLDAETDEQFEVNLSNVQFAGVEDGSRVAIADAQGIATLLNNDPTQLNLSLLQGQTDTVNEIIFVDTDEQGRINGLTPDDAGFTQALLDNAEVLFSTLRQGRIPTLDPSRVLSINDDQTFQFAMIEAGSLDSLRNGGEGTLQLLSNGEEGSLVSARILQTQSSLTLRPSKGESDDDGDSNGELVFSIDTNTTDVPMGVGLQGSSNPETELLDFRGLTGTSTATFEVYRDASFDNIVGFYFIENEQGQVRDAFGNLLNPDDAGYVQAAMANRLTNIELTGENGTTSRFTTEIELGQLLSTFIVVDGTVDALVDSDSANDPAVYFTHMGANADRADHVRLLGSNIFGFEDLAGGGDFDFDDLIVKASFV